MIQTVNDKLDEKTISKILSHEHFVFGRPDYIKGENNNYDREVAYDKSIKMIKLIKSYDVNFILDATTIEWGRDPILLQRLAKDTGMNIVCSTGFFKDDNGAISYLKSISYSVDIEEYLIDLFTKEIMVGIGDTDCKAGAIKVACSKDHMTSLERSIYIAAAKTNLKTGTPILTHSDQGTMGVYQTNLLIEQGVNPASIVIGHMSSNHDVNEQIEIMKLGVKIGYDQFGIESIPNIPKDAEKLENLITLLKAGYEDQIVISHDNCFDRMGYVSKSKPRFPSLIFEFVIPKMKENGITDYQIEKLLKWNVIEWFQEK